MTPSPPNDVYANLRAMYKAIVDYHNQLAQIRFTVAGLHLAATGILVSSWFGRSSAEQSYPAIPLIGLTITALCALMDVRTYQLLDNLGIRGGEIERELGISDARGFFALMRDQPMPARIRKRGKQLNLLRVSHSFALGGLYAIILLFWTSALLGTMVGILLATVVGSFLWGYFSQER